MDFGDGVTLLIWEITNRLAQGVSRKSPTKRLSFGKASSKKKPLLFHNLFKVFHPSTTSLESQKRT